MKKRIAAALIAAMMAGTVITGCGTDAKTEAPAVQSTVAAAEQAPEAEEAKEERHILGRYVSGIDNRAVLEGAKSIDYLIKAESVNYPPLRRWRALKRGLVRERRLCFFSLPQPG